MSRPILIVREAALACPLVAVVVAFPVALRVPPAAFLESWARIAALLCVPLALFIAAARMARRSLGELLPESRRALFVGVTVWALLSFPVHAVLGLVLKATTHHRGLGGATFGALALVANLAVVLLAWRFSGLARRGGMIRGALNACLAVAAVVLTAIAARAALAVPGGALVLDGVVAVAATLLAARWDLPERH